MVAPQFTVMYRFPHINNLNGVEFNVIKVTNHEDWTIIGIYRSPQVLTRQLYVALNNILAVHGADNMVILGDFKINLMVADQRQSLYNVMIEDNGYQQLITSCTTDYNIVCIPCVYQYYCKKR